MVLVIPSAVCSGSSLPADRLRAGLIEAQVRRLVSLPSFSAAGAAESNFWSWWGHTAHNTSQPGTAVGDMRVQ